MLLHRVRLAPSWHVASWLSLCANSKSREEHSRRKAPKPRNQPVGEGQSPGWPVWVQMAPGRWTRGPVPEEQHPRGAHRATHPALPCALCPSVAGSGSGETASEGAESQKRFCLCSGLPSQPGTAVTSGGCTAPFICRCAVQRAPVSSASFWGDLPRSDVGLKFPLEKLWAIRMVSVLWGL